MLIVTRDVLNFCEIEVVVNVVKEGRRTYLFKRTFERDELGVESDGLDIEAPLVYWVEGFLNTRNYHYELVVNVWDSKGETVIDDVVIIIGDKEGN